MRTSEMYAVVNDDGPNHFYKNKFQVEMVSSKEIGKYRLTEDPEGDYWAWWGSGDDCFLFCWPEEFLLEMCFHSGTKPCEGEEPHQGHKMRVSIERLD